MTSKWVAAVMAGLIVILASVVAEATPTAAPTPTPAPQTRASKCLSATHLELGQQLKDVLLAKAHPVLGQRSSLPDGDEGGVIIANLSDIKPSHPLSFRILLSSAPHGWRQFATDATERGPTSVVHGVPGEGADSYLLNFSIPEAASAFPFHIRTHREVYVVACDGEEIAAWGADNLVFAPQGAARVWALAVVIAIYVLAGGIVWLRRREVARDDDDTHPTYRIAKVDEWPILKCLDPVAMTADVFDRGNLSKFQILFFMMLIVYGLAYLAIWKGDLVGLSPSLVYLLGIPALGTLGAGAAALSRDRLSADNWSWLVRRRVLPINQEGDVTRPKWADLIMSDTELDITKLQALTFSAVVAISMWVSGPAVFATFQVPDSLLQILGLSQLVFVGGRFTKPSSLQDLDGLISELRKREGALRRAASTGVDVDESGKPLRPAPDPAPRTVGADLDKAKAVVPTAVGRYVETARQVEVMFESLSRHVVDSRPLSEVRVPLAVGPVVVPTV